MSYDIIWYRYRYSFGFLFDSVQFIYIYIQFIVIPYCIILYLLYMICTICTCQLLVPGASPGFTFLGRDSAGVSVKLDDGEIKKLRRRCGSVRKFMVSSWLNQVSSSWNSWNWVRDGNGLNGPLEDGDAGLGSVLSTWLPNGTSKCRMRKGKIWNAQGRHGLPEPPSMHKV